MDSGSGKPEIVRSPSSSSSPVVNPTSSEEPENEISAPDETSGNLKLDNEVKNEVIVEEPLGPSVPEESAMEKSPTVIDPGRLGTPEMMLDHEHEFLPPLMPLEPIPGVPLGLEFLVDMNKLEIRRQTAHERDGCEVMTAFQTNKRYDVLNSDGKRIYCAGEIIRKQFISCGGVERPFDVVVLDFTGREVLQLKKNSDCKLCCTAGCYFCFNCLGNIGGKIDVYLPDKTFVGSVTHSFGWYRPIYKVTSNGKALLKIRGLTRCGDCFFRQKCSKSGQNQVFLIFSDKGDEIGAIQRSPLETRKSLERAVLLSNFEDQQYCMLSFARELDVSIKVLLLAAAFLLNWMYYCEESSEPDELREAEYLFLADTELS